jgi:CRISPR-associated protein Csm3
MKLISIKELKGKIILKSGLHIGSGNMEMQIGGTDSPVIKHPHTFEPYIPGSSLKGKVRSLLEMASGLVPFAAGSGGLVTVKVWKSLEDENLKKKAEAILKIFGSSGSESEEDTDFGPTRASFADCYLNGDWKKKAQSNRWQLTEVKSENVINRIKGTAEHPRFIERVPEGTEFDFLITYKVLNETDEVFFNKYLLTGLKLLELDAIGGSGSRGYGRLKFEFADAEISNKFTELTPF